MSSIASILLIRPSALGDVCRTVPILVSLRRAYPDARIDWLVQAEFADAIWHHPGLSEAVLFDRRGIGSALKRADIRPLVALIARLRQARYDMAIDAQGLARSALLARLSGARLRIGYARPEAREGAWLWYNRRIHVDSASHAVSRMMALARSAGGVPARGGALAGVDEHAVPPADLRLFTGPAERAWAHNTLGDLALPPRRYAVIAPTSRWPGKRWPADRFARIARSLLDHVDAVVIVGSASERSQGAPLLEHAEPRIIDLIGRTTVGQLMAVIQGSALVIANDSAALHMAVGFERPLVGLYGPTRIPSSDPAAANTMSSSTSPMATRSTTKINPEAAP